MLSKWILKISKNGQHDGFFQSILAARCVQQADAYNSEFRNSVLMRHSYHTLINVILVFTLVLHFQTSNAQQSWAKRTINLKTFQAHLHHVRGPHTRFTCVICGGLEQYVGRESHPKTVVLNIIVQRIRSLLINTIDLVVFLISCEFSASKIYVWYAYISAWLISFVVNVTCYVTYLYFLPCSQVFCIK